MMMSEQRANKKYIKAATMLYTDGNENKNNNNNNKIYSKELQIKRPATKGDINEKENNLKINFFKRIICTFHQFLTWGSIRQA